RGRRGGTSRASLTTLALHQRTVLANKQVEMVALFVSELQEDLFALGVFEALAVLLEEAMRASLAADPDDQRVLSVDAAHQPFGALSEQAVGSALEEQERRTRFELWVAAEQFAVARLEFAQVFLLLHREILEHLPAPRVLGDACRAGIEVEAAALGRNRDAHGVAREDEVGMPFRARHRGAPGPALFTGSVDLHHALRCGETARRSHFLDRTFNVGAEELERTMAALADEMKVTGLTVRVLEPETPLTEIDPEI